MQYRFSPIQSDGALLKAVEYVARTTTLLAEKIVGEPFPIKSLTIFSHDQLEYENLVKILAELGMPYNESNGPRVVLHNPIIAGDNKITHLRIRKPDLERPQVGCNDFETDYTAFKEQYLDAHPGNLRLIKRPAYEMIELSDPEFDVLAYVVSPEITPSVTPQFNMLK